MPDIAAVCARLRMHVRVVRHTCTHTCDSVSRARERIGSPEWHPFQTGPRERTPLFCRAHACTHMRAHACTQANASKPVCPRGYLGFAIIIGRTTAFGRFYVRSTSNSNGESRIAGRNVQRIRGLNATVAEYRPRLRGAPVFSSLLSPVGRRS